MSKTILLIDMWIHTRHNEKAGIYISGIERVCNEELTYALESGNFDIYLISSRRKEEFLTVLQKNVPELQQCKVLYMPKTAWWGKLLRFPLSVFSRLIQKSDWGCRYILSRCLPLITSSWTWGTKKLSNLPELKGKKVIYYSCFRSFHPSVMKDKNILKAATIHDIIPLRYFKFENCEYYGYLADFYILSKYSDFLFWVSKFTKDDFMDFFPKTKASGIVNYCAADSSFHPHNENEISSIRKKYNIPEGKKYILSVAASAKRKNIDLLIQCFLKMLSMYQVDDIQMVLVGSFYAEDNNLKRLIDCNSHVITMTGFVEEADLPVLYSGASCYCFLSDYEGFGLPLIEAFQTGCPVICSNLTCLPEIAGNAAIEVSTTDENVIAQTIWEICNNKNLSADLKTKGAIRAKDFSWEKHGENFVTSLENL